VGAFKSVGKARGNIRGVTMWSAIRPEAWKSRSEKERRVGVTGTNDADKGRMFHREKLAGNAEKQLEPGALGVIMRNTSDLRRKWRRMDTGRGG